MIKKLQRNFIRIAALTLLSVILIVAASINGVFLYQCNQLLDNKLEDMLIRHTGKDDDIKNRPKQENAPTAEAPRKNVPSHLLTFSHCYTRICRVLLPAAS